MRFLDAAALNWQKERQCFACHSDYLFFNARPLISWQVPAHAQMRERLEYLAEHPRDVPYRATEAVMVASMLAQNDALTTGKLHPTTRKALDHMWSMQRQEAGSTGCSTTNSVRNRRSLRRDDGCHRRGCGTGALCRHAYRKSRLNGIRNYFTSNPPAHLHTA